MWLGPVFPTLLNCENEIQKYFGLIKGIESDFELALFKEIPGITDATHLGNSNSLKFCFTDARSLDHALKRSIRIEYKLIRVSVFHDLPRRCNKCRLPNHQHVACESSSPKCSRCTGPHKATRDSPCQIQPKCTNCDGSHVFYSLRYPILRDIVNSRKKTPNLEWMN